MGLGKLSDRSDIVGPVPRLVPRSTEAVVPGDRIVAADDYGDVVLQVVEVSPWMVVCVDVGRRWVCCRV